MAFQANAFQNDTFQSKPFAKDNVSAYLCGIDYNPESHQKAYLYGNIASNDNVKAYLVGKDNISNSTKGYLEGVSFSRITTVGVQVEYNLEHSDRITSAGVQIEYRLAGKDFIHGYLEGTAFGKSSSTPAYLCGLGIVNNSIKALLHGAKSTNSDIQAYLYGISLEKSSVQSFLLGKNTDISQADVFCCGKVEINSDIPVFLYGKATISSSIHVFASTGINISDAIYSYLIGQITKSDLLPAYVKGQLVTQDSLNAYLNGSVAEINVLSSTHVFTIGKDNISTLSLVYLSGKTSDFNSIHTFLKGQIEDLGSNTHIFLSGKDTARTSISAFVSSIKITSSSIASYLYGHKLHTPAYLFGSININGNKHSYLLGIGKAYSDKTAYLRGRKLPYTISSGLEFIYLGEPFVRVAAKIGIQLSKLDYIYLAEPFYGLDNLIPTKETKHAYTIGFSYHPFVKSPAFLSGYDPHSDIRAYLLGNLHAAQAKSAYTNAVVILAMTDTNTFVSGNIANSSSAHAYITPTIGNTTSSLSAHINGISRGFVNCYLNGTTTIRDYIILETDDRLISKKFTVLKQDYDDGTQERSETIKKTISGGLSKDIGEIYTSWSMIIKVRAEEPKEGYGNRDNLEYFWKLNNPNATPSNIITFVDHRGYEYKVNIKGNMRKNLITVAVEGTEAIYFYRLELIEVNSV